MHTKGPWTRLPTRMLEGSDHGIIVESINGEYVASALDLHPFNRDKEIEANAHLIAAAPELLDVLEQVMHCRIQITPKLLRRAKAVLLEAKGLPTD